jgi:hypothetical protein
MTPSQDKMRDGLCSYLNCDEAEIKLLFIID